jgi:phage regulator Rha-like protein
MRLVFRGSIHFYVNNVDISIASYQVANFFNIEHDGKLIPMINGIFKYSDHGFRQVNAWSTLGKKNYISHYHLNKEGCTIICEKIKPEKSLKKEFLTLTENL